MSSDVTSSDVPRVRSSSRTFAKRSFLICLLSLFCAAIAHAQEPSAPQSMPAAQLQAAIDKLGDLDYDTRTAASRTVRRTSPEQAVPSLLRAVAEHADGYVRYRALVL